MPIIPTLADARDLRISHADNPVIDRAETALRALHVSAVDAAAAMLPMWAHAAELSPRERLAVLARFVCVEVVDDGARVCGAPVTDEVSWPDVTRAEYPESTQAHPYRTFRIEPDGTMCSTAIYPHRVVKRVCDSCADWVLGLGGSHLHPTRRPLGGAE